MIKQSAFRPVPLTLAQLMNMNSFQISTMQNGYAIQHYGLIYYMPYFVFYPLEVK